jgi:hypothetical protein
VFPFDVNANDKVATRFELPTVACENSSVK